MTVQAGRAETRQRRATYQDVLDAPTHKVAEVIAGSLHTHPRPAMRHAWASSNLGGAMSIRSVGAAAVRAAGGSSTNLNFTWAKTSWYRILPVGGARRRPNIRTRLIARSRQTGSARCSHRPRGGLTRAKSAISMPAKASAISGSSIPMCGRLKLSSCGTGISRCRLL